MPVYNYTSVDDPAGSITIANAINASGQIVSLKGYDEPEILPSSTHPICPMSADGGHSTITP